MPTGPTSSDEAQIKFRIDAELRAHLEASAKQKGISLNREITERLKQSRANEGVEDIDHSRPTYGLLKALDEVMEAAGMGRLFMQTHSWETARQQNWLEDGAAFAEAVNAATEFLKAVAPEAPKQVAPIMHDGHFWAEFFLRQIASGKPNVPENKEKIDKLRQALGQKTVQRLKPFAEIDPDDRAHKRLLKKGAQK